MSPKTPNFADMKPDYPAKKLPVLKNRFETDRKEIKLTKNRTYLLANQTDTFQ